MPHHDGLQLDTSTATVVTIRDDDEYAGVRVSLTASLATAQFALHVDVNVGDPIWPSPETVTVPRLLGGEITLLGYPIGMVLAEKLVTAGQRGGANTRWRDFADIYSLIRSHPLDADEVHYAIRTVAQRRQVELRPLRASLDGYAEAGQKRWAAGRARQNLTDRIPLTFADVLADVLTFADGCYATPASAQTWSPRGLTWT